MGPSEAYTPNSSDYLDPATPTRRRKEWRRERIEEDNARAAEAAAVAAEEAAAEEEARFERRNLQPEYAIADMRSQLLWLIYAAFMSITTAVIIFLLLGYLTINPMLWSIPDPARLAEYDKLYADAWKHTKYMETFEQFEIYLLNQPTMSQDICFDMTSVICEPFLLAMPNMSYQDFLRNLSVYFPSSNVKSPNSTDIWNWDAARTPYDLVIFAHIFSFNELKIFSTCVTFIQRERQKLLRKMRPGDRMNLYSRIRLNREWAKYMVIGICKLANLGMFLDRLDLLRKFCLAGCGKIPHNDTDSIDWTLLCDSLHILSLDIRSFHRCQWINPTESCGAAVELAKKICRNDTSLTEPS